MKVFFIWLVCLINFCNCKEKLINFGDEEEMSTRPAKIIQHLKPFQNGGKPGAKSECGCVPKETCADPGVFGPRETPKRRTIIFDDSAEEDKSSKIINNPPPGPECVNSVYCCTIIPTTTTLPDKNPFHCGTRPTFIPRHFRPEAEFGEYPWMALILLEQDENLSFIANGALLDEFTVLTTAHNVHKFKDDNCKNLKARLGEFDRGSRSEPFPYVEVEVDQVIIHKDFNPQSLENDIALVKLDPSCQLRKSIGPHINTICLPEYNTEFTNERCWVPGYGTTETGKYSNILRHVDLKILDGNFCQDLLQKSFLGSGFTLHKNSFICAGGEAGKDSCTKDGGSALVCHRGGRWQLAGLVSWGIGCGKAGLPGVYSNVPKYVNWIRERMR